MAQQIRCTHHLAECRRVCLGWAAVDNQVAMKWGEEGDGTSSSGIAAPQVLRTAEEAEELVAREVEVMPLAWVVCFHRAAVVCISLGPRGYDSVVPCRVVS